MLSSCRTSLKRAHNSLNTTICRTEYLANFYPGCRQYASTQATSIDRRQRGENDTSYSILQKPSWKFTSATSLQGKPSGPSLARFNLQISHHARNGRLIECLALCKVMKDENVRPDLYTYNLLLSACSFDGLPEEAWAIIDDMTATDISPDLTSFHHLINASRSLESHAMWEIIDKMQNFGVMPTAATFSYILTRYVEAGNLEMALCYLAEMNSRDLVPEMKVTQRVIILAAEIGQAKLALDLAKAYEATAVRGLENEVWVNCLLAAATSFYAEGTLHAWDVVTKHLKISPDEGLCIDVLNSAARHGLPDLATDVIRTLKHAGAPLKEYHFAPLIEAFCRVNRIKDAFAAVDIMRSSSIEPTLHTAEPIFKAISHDIETVDATWGMLDEMRDEGLQVDVCVVNVVIQAALHLGDLQRAVGTYKTFPDYNVKPTTETFNLLLSGCVDAEHRELGDKILSEMKEAGVKPDLQTYAQLINLCLTQATYEDAFFYLEEMKERKHVPTLSIYEAIIRKCVSVGDTRYTIAVEELNECGYKLSNALKRILPQSTIDTIEPVNSDTL